MNSVDNAVGKNEICKKFLKFGECMFGDKCKNLHDIPSIISSPPGGKIFLSARNEQDNMKTIQRNKFEKGENRNMKKKKTIQPSSIIVVVNKAPEYDRKVSNNTKRHQEPPKFGTSSQNTNPERKHQKNLTLRRKPFYPERRREGVSPFANSSISEKSSREDYFSRQPPYMPYHSDPYKSMTPDAYDYQRMGPDYTRYSSPYMQRHSHLSPESNRYYQPQISPHSGHTDIFYEHPLYNPTGGSPHDSFSGDLRRPYQNAPYNRPPPVNNRQGDDGRIRDWTRLKRSEDTRHINVRPSDYRTSTNFPDGERNNQNVNANENRVRRNSSFERVGQVSFKGTMPPPRLHTAKYYLSKYQRGHAAVVRTKGLTSSRYPLTNRPRPTLFRSKNEGQSRNREENSRNSLQQPLQPERRSINVPKVRGKEASQLNVSGAAPGDSHRSSRSADTSKSIKSTSNDSQLRTRQRNEASNNKPVAKTSGKELKGGLKDKSLSGSNQTRKSSMISSGAEVQISRCVLPSKKEMLAKAALAAAKDQGSTLSNMQALTPTIDNLLSPLPTITKPSSASPSPASMLKGSPFSATRTPNLDSVKEEIRKRLVADEKRKALSAAAIAAIAKASGGPNSTIKAKNANANGSNNIIVDDEKVIDNKSHFNEHNIVPKPTLKTQEELGSLEELEKQRQRLIMELQDVHGNEQQTQTVGAEKDQNYGPALASSFKSTFKTIAHKPSPLVVEMLASNVSLTDSVRYARVKEVVTKKESLPTHNPEDENIVEPMEVDEMVIKGKKDEIRNLQISNELFEETGKPATDSKTFSDDFSSLSEDSSLLEEQQVPFDRNKKGRERKTSQELMVELQPMKRRIHRRTDQQVNPRSIAETYFKKEISEAETSTSSSTEVDRFSRGSAKGSRHRIKRGARRAAKHKARRVADSVAYTSESDDIPLNPLEKSSEVEEGECLTSSKANSNSNSGSVSTSPNTSSNSTESDKESTKSNPGGSGDIKNSSSNNSDGSDVVNSSPTNASPEHAKRSKKSKENTKKHELQEKDSKHPPSSKSSRSSPIKFPVSLRSSSRSSNASPSISPDKQVIPPTQLAEKTANINLDKMIKSQFGDNSNSSTGKQLKQSRSSSALLPLVSDELRQSMQQRMVESSPACSNQSTMNVEFMDTSNHLQVKEETSQPNAKPDAIKKPMTIADLDRMIDEAYLPEEENTPLAAIDRQEAPEPVNDPTPPILALLKECGISKRLAGDELYNKVQKMIVLNKTDLTSEELSDKKEYNFFKHPIGALHALYYSNFTSIAEMAKEERMTNPDPDDYSLPKMSSSTDPLEFLQNTGVALNHDTSLRFLTLLKRKKLAEARRFT